MTRHFELMSKWNAHISSKAFERENLDDRMLLMNYTIHIADVSMMMKSVNAKKWHDLQIDENFKQVSYH